MEHLCKLGMSGRPLFEFELVVEHVTFEKVTALNSLVHEFNQVFLEQEAADKVVLVLDDVINHESNRSHLVVFKGNINS